MIAYGQLELTYGHYRDMTRCRCSLRYFTNQLKYK